MPLRRPHFLLFLVACLPSAPAGHSAAAPSPSAPSVNTTGQLLTTAREIRALPPAEAGRRIPVKIRAIVTGFRSATEFGYHVVDDTGPIFVTPDSSSLEERPALVLGQVIAIEGVSDPGKYAPQVREFRRTVVGHFSLPPPPRLTYEQMASGREDCQRAEIEGIVRSVSQDGLALAMGEGIVDVSCPVPMTGNLQHLVDARVRLQGVVSGRFNQKRQWVAVRFTVSTPEGIIVEKPARADPFAAPAHSIGELLQWELNQSGRHRVKVGGVVTHFQPGEALFIREGATGLQIHTTETQALASGDQVEVLGFPALGTYSAILEDAVFRRTGRVDDPRPVNATPEQMLRGEWDASLVAVRGVLLESIRQHGAQSLVMQAGDIIFHARLGATGSEAPELPAAGSLLELTGICVVAETTVVGARLSPSMFAVLLRSAADIRIVQAPSWWTARRLGPALGILTCVALGILSWVWLLRRQVRTQTAKLTEQTQREAILEERTRIAQELHDTLDQELTGISLQLNAAVSKLKDDPMGRRLELVHRLLQRSQSEVRRSVWDLRRAALESDGLAAVLKDTATQLRNGSTATLEVSVHGSARSLPALVGHHLLRIAAEAMTNAFKHACAGRIHVELYYEPGAARLCVTDDGRGFDATVVPGHATGHFGLIGMRERTRKIGGTLTLESRPSHGTRIEIRVPETQNNGRAHPARKPAPVRTP